MFPFLLQLQTAVSNLKISIAKSSYCSNNGFPPLVKRNAPRKLNNFRMPNIPITWSNPFLPLVETKSNSLRITIYSVVILTCDDSSTKYLLVISVLATATFSGFAQL